MAKRRRKNPFVNGSIKDIQIAEDTSYYMVVGGDIFRYANQITFSASDIAFHYEQIKTSLQDLVNEGDEQVSADAAKSLLTLKVMRLRIQ